MKIEEIVCDLEHAKALAEIGVLIGKTAFVWSGVMIVSDDPAKNRYVLEAASEAAGFEDYAAPTAEELLNILNPTIRYDLNYLLYLGIHKIGDTWRISYEMPTYSLYKENRNLSNAIIELLLYFKSLGVTDLIKED